MGNLPEAWSQRASESQVVNRNLFTRVTEPNLQVKQPIHIESICAAIFSHQTTTVTSLEIEYHLSNRPLQYSILSQRIGTATATAEAALLLERARDMWAELKRETDVARTQQLLDSLG